MVWYYSKLLHQTSFGLAMGGAVPWLWPLFKVLHFAGMALFVGGCVAFNLRLLGVARELPSRAPAEACPVGHARVRDHGDHRPRFLCRLPQPVHELALFLQDGVHRARRRERAAVPTPPGSIAGSIGLERDRMCRSPRKSSP